MTFGATALTWLADALQHRAQDLQLTRLRGATSSQVWRVQAGPVPLAVLRVLDNQRWLASEPDLAEHEYAALTFAHSRGLRAPRALAHATQHAGFGAPVVLMSHLDGDVRLHRTGNLRWLLLLAEELAHIHSHAAHDLPWRYKTWTERSALAVPAWSSIPAAWRHAIEIVLGPEPPVAPVLIHRDYHPTNVLWRDGPSGEVISGVVDWINACSGPAGVDVAHCRANLAMMIGTDAADAFLSAYQRAAPDFDYQPYWELDGILDTGRNPSFYPPWSEFGLPAIPAPALRDRVERYLESILRRT